VKGGYKDDMKQAMRSLNDKSPTLLQKIGIIEKWFLSRKGASTNGAITIRQAGDVILEKFMATDIDSAMKIAIN